MREGKVTPRGTGIHFTPFPSNPQVRCPVGALLFIDLMGNGFGKTITSR